MTGIPCTFFNSHGSELLSSKSSFGLQQCNFNSTLSPDNPVQAPPMVYIAGEEMTHYAMNLIIDQCVNPYFDTSKWEHFDLSCKSRDVTNDKVLHDAVDAGKRVGAIFKEPTITPSAIQVSNSQIRHRIFINSIKLTYSNHINITIH